ncbi:GntR family transcriptional regulator [Stenotrophomonas sp. MMGLT7]|uniref:GntR family transcriptional regulator n=1 Tax=Stenotrophomonas sp. MMGLT7 TaxID=2901227 RepID=UPI001E302F70|nr:GntR family transcriptional regulator [Stenotrophomonas sp. MMGLT7]MCD7099961.1 GntR family transcriptional regulator [Stenotrophomonas sp. MMGLT7]
MDELSLDPAAPTPLYLQLAAKLGDEIRGGKWRGGEALPAERHLCEKLGISRVTLRQAVDALVEQGLVTRRQGAGTFVSSQIQHQLSGLTSFSETLRLKGFEPGTRWLEQRLRPAHGEEILRLGLSPDTVVAALTRLRSADGRVMAYEQAVLPQHIVPDPAAVGDSLYAYLDARGHAVVRALQYFRAINLPARLAGHLGMKTGEAILHVVRVGYTRDGSAIELTDTYCHNDYYDFVAELRR